ncbi:hypothetical protein R3P38DRAFT_3480578 [Favolaschia claudopus]|uniref:DUF6589 domain-containing protein n=1 Tax=Favolaschia claudopus TaxID=2862362 RepID=A0AAW0CD72_9AGAR
MFLCDVLPYILLRTAIKHGDVGLMEDLISEMLYRFVGGNNSKYQMLELLQGLNREWPRELVINNTGRREGHMPVDEAQEMNILKGYQTFKQINSQVTHRSEGPNIDWDYLKKLHPAIHVIRSVTSHMETEFKTRVRGWRHTIPKREIDIQGLQKWYRASRTHKFVANRKMPAKSDGDRPTEFVTKGFTALQTGKTLENWIEGRTVEQATHQDWDSQTESSEVSQ